MRSETTRLAALAALLAVAACREAPPASPMNHAGAPEPMPAADNLASDAEMADRAAEAEARDAQIGGNNSGADANLQ
jgi:hypothetical protein